MKAQKTRQARTGTIAKHSRLTFEGIGSLIEFRHHAAKPVNMQGSFSTQATSGARVEEQLAFELDTERRRMMGRTYSNMIPPR
jgi:hypothetical protein